MAKKAKVEKVTSSDLLKVFWNSWFIQSAWNYERMMGQGYLHGMTPILRKLHPDEKEYLDWVKLHLEFYNTEPHISNIIVGMDIAMEEKGADMETIRGLKSALMGPFAGLGDSMIWLTLLPIIFAIGASMGVTGSLLGPVIAVVVWIAASWAIKYFTLVYGYRYGLGMADLLKGEALVTFREAVSAFGLAMCGALAATYVWGAHTPLVLEVSGVKVVIQDMLNLIMPALLSLIFVLFNWVLLRRGYSLTKTVAVTFVLGFVLALLGILG